MTTPRHPDFGDKNYVVVVEEHIGVPDGRSEGTYVYTEAAWTDNLDFAEAAMQGICTDKLARALIKEENWLGACFVYDVGADYGSSDHYFGIDAEDVTELAKPGMWLP